MRRKQYRVGVYRAGRIEFDGCFGEHLTSQRRDAERGARDLYKSYPDCRWGYAVEVDGKWVEDVVVR